MLKNQLFIVFFAFVMCFVGCEQSRYSPSSIYYEKNVGLSVGGAKDINNFRENIANQFLPLPTDITYEGLFYDYFFDTGQTEACEKLFCPSYTSAVSKDPFSQKEEYFLSVGLNSGIKKEDFSRKKLNLVIVIDISSSMDGAFDRYYYDQHRKKELFDKTSEKELFVENEEEDLNKTKLQVASESVVALMDHLKPEDSFGVVLFENQAHLGKSLTKVKDIHLKNIKDHILNLSAEGGTNMSAGMQLATELLEDRLKEETDGEFENRIIFLTDAQPNTGMIGEEELLDMVKANSERKIYTSFIGVGVDFNTELIEFINKTQGANYYAAHSPLEFKKRLDDEFDFMVTPLAFDLELKVKAPGFKIKKVYGSPSADSATGEIMKVATLFPSQRTNDETRGGIVLLQLEKISPAADSEIQLTASYKDRKGTANSHSVEFEFKQSSEFYDNTGIRKGLLLVRYANLIKNWILRERKPKQETTENFESLYKEKGIFIPTDEVYQLGRWERQSMELSVSSGYKKLFKQFHSYFEKEMKEIGDSSLDKELEVLKVLSSNSEVSSSEPSPAQPPGEL
ncbi:MAG: VWA domain-containing protein [Oligoflexia bacterium]|nr:VWA domain-containing protein [Oligoflexia bacterium]